MVSLSVYEKNPNICDVEIFPVFEGESAKAELKAKEYEFEKLTLFRARTEGEKSRLYVGMGKKDLLTPYRLRRAGGSAARFVREGKYKNAALNPEFASGVLEFTEGFLLGSYVFDKYKSKDRAEDLVFHLVSSSLSAEDIKKAETASRGVSFTRDLSNLSTDELYPEAFAKIVTERFAGTKVSVRVYKADELLKEGFAGTEAVGRAGKHKPCYVELSYVTESGLPLIALIGKGVTFDMGGVNVKIGRDLSAMKSDMSGAAAVAGAMDILSSRGAAANVKALIPLVENLPDSNALLPGMIVKYPKDITVEVKNTDAEGRLILADAILHAKRLGAAKMIDIATLTGSVAAALGNRFAGIFGGDELCEELRAIGNETGDRMWRMPLVDDYTEYLKSSSADITNTSSEAEGGSITAALFLKHFAEDETNWAHIDMAGISVLKTPYSYMPEGASGFGTRLLAEYVLRRA